jgi:hypothetical protein
MSSSDYHTTKSIHGDHNLIAFLFRTKHHGLESRIWQWESLPATPIMTILQERLEEATFRASVTIGL